MLLTEELVYVAEAVTDDCEVVGRSPVTTRNIPLDALTQTGRRIAELERKISARYPSIQTPRGAA